ncbi:hypothetical protein EXIGLDRAFT_763558 [Exidia glandulosa HHB12029]|uniref:F-box domain-containing protein n=1 Tax=Exidia glandulosa HHB12029 TaxID=1314781 RepID=A0A165LW08_EXIGL|nr:hypothetical protein EXIGLDRAFT_763558 [Exidia glandulosa HHB12029]
MSTAVILAPSVELLMGQLVGEFTTTAFSAMALPDADAPSILQEYKDAARLCLDRSLAVALRTRNIAASQQSLLPQEVWCLVWQELPLFQRVRVTHVCHFWRTVGLASHQLWRNVDICPAAAASDARSEAEFYPNSDLEDDYVEGHTFPLNQAQSNVATMTTVRTSIQMLEEILPRSGSLKFHLVIQARMDGYGDYSSRHLARIVKPHVERLSSLHIAFSDTDCATVFLQEVQPFPALRVLTTEFVKENHRPLHNSKFNLKNFGRRDEEDAFPVLETLVLDTPLAWLAKNDSYCHNLPTLRSATVAVSGTTGLMSLLHHCQALKTLHVLAAAGEPDPAASWHPPYFGISPEDNPHRDRRGYYNEERSTNKLYSGDIVRRTASQIRNLNISGITPAAESALFAVFTGPGLSLCRKVAVGYVDEPGSAGLAALFEAWSPARVHFSYTNTGATFNVTAWDAPADGRRKRLSVPCHAAYDTLARIWEHLSLDAITEMTVDAVLWMFITHGMAHMPHLASVTLLVRSAKSPVIPSSRVYFDPARTDGPFAPIKAMQLDGPSSGLPMSVETVVAIICSASTTPRGARNSALETRYTRRKREPTEQRRQNDDYSLTETVFPL